MKKALKNAARGAIFPYAGEKWVVLEHEAGGRTLCLRLDLIPNKPFDEDNRNNFAISSSKEWMNGPYLDNLIDAVKGPHAFLSTELDLTADDGLKDYGTCTVTIFSLTVDQYGRYMDDFYIISSDKLLLREILKRIEEYIKPLGLRLNGKTQIFPLKNGIDFLGFHTYLTSTGKVVRKVRAKSIDNMKRKIRKFRGLVDRGKMTLESVGQSYASWTGHISHGNTYHLRHNMDA